MTWLSIREARRSGDIILIKPEYLDGPLGIVFPRRAWRLLARNNNVAGRGIICSAYNIRKQGESTPPALSNLYQCPFVQISSAYNLFCYGTFYIEREMKIDHVFHIKHIIVMK